MGLKRKFEGKSAPDAQKRLKHERPVNLADGVATGATSHPVLSRYYRQIISLRHFVRAQLKNAGASKRKLRLISQVGTDAYRNPEEVDLGCLLDNTLVGIVENAECDFQEADTLIGADLNELASQLENGDSTVLSDVSQGHVTQPQIVRSAIWLVFKRNAGNHKPAHILCHGYQRAYGVGCNGFDSTPESGIPGIVALHRNSHVTTLQEPPWCMLLDALGKHGSHIMVDLLANHGIFMPVSGGQGNYYQLSGVPLPELQTLPSAALDDKCPVSCLKTHASAGTGPRVRSVEEKVAAIRFVRHRMLYANCNLNGKGAVRFGLQRSHVLNRYPDVEDLGQTVHVMKYIFPRQFGLHNVFTSVVDYRETAQPLKDYTFREQEIARLDREKRHRDGKLPLGIPRRLRGKATDLVQKMRTLHCRCPYAELVRYYCASPENEVNPETALEKLATPAAHVSAFCRAVVMRVVPHEFWGTSDKDFANRDAFFKYLDKFILMSRFESLTLHEVTQNIKVSRLDWLDTPHQDRSGSMALSDMNKRREIFHEFMYYLYDSFITPLIRSNFHVTESNMHRNRLFYFRHDIWRRATEPYLGQLKVSMFEEMAGQELGDTLDGRVLGHSHIRLLPKQAGLRPIINLRRRVVVRRDARVYLNKSINSVLEPAYQALKYEKDTHPDNAGSSLFSVGDMFPKIKAFQRSLRERGVQKKRLYFAKVDVQSCFDTIPQEKVIHMAEKLLAPEGYNISRYAELRPPDGHQYRPDYAPMNPTARYKAKAIGAASTRTFADTVQEELSTRRKDTVFTDKVVQHLARTPAMLSLLREHVRCNIIKIGKKYYRQKNGIPQGSVVSSLLCSFFYAEMEKQCLSSLGGPNHLLLRLIDDFLFISLDRETAYEFLQIMHSGNVDYGISVKADKSLANFDAEIGGKRVAKVSPPDKFPYCGNLIDMKSLGISKNRRRAAGLALSDTFTVEFSRMPGQSFHRKVLNMLKIQMNAMFFDTTFNTKTAVLSNLYQALHETASKAFLYLKCLGAHKQPPTTLLMKTVGDVTKLAVVLAQKKGRRKVEWLGYECSIGTHQVAWLGCTAFLDVFDRKQTKYADFLMWLRAEREVYESKPSWRREAGALCKAILGR